MSSYDDIFAASYARVMQRGDYNPEFIGFFYDEFTASSPHVGERFRGTDMSRQKTMLHDSFNTLIDFNHSRQLTDQMRHLGEVHATGANDIPPELYTLWLDSLIRTVAHFDAEFDSDVELAWRLTLAPGIAYLQHIYRQAT